MADRPFALPPGLMLRVFKQENNTCYENNLLFYALNQLLLVKIFVCLFIWNSLSSGFPKQFSISILVLPFSREDVLFYFSSVWWWWWGAVLLIF